MPLECIDIGVRSGDDISIIDDALTMQAIYERSKWAKPDFGTGPGTLVGDVEDENEVPPPAAACISQTPGAAGGREFRRWLRSPRHLCGAARSSIFPPTAPSARARCGQVIDEATKKAEAELEANKHKTQGPDGLYFKRHETSSRVHADWDNEASTHKTFSVDDQVRRHTSVRDVEGAVVRWAHGL